MSWPANRFAKSASVSDSKSDVTSQCRSTLIKVIQEGRATRGGHTLEGEARGQMCRIDLEQVLSCALCQSRYEQILTRAPTKWTWNIISVFKIEWIYIVLFKKKLRVEFLKTKPANAQAVRHQSLCANTSVSFFWLASFLGQHVTPDALKENRLCLVLWSSVVTLLRVDCCNLLPTLFFHLVTLAISFRFVALPSKCAPSSLKSLLVFKELRDILSLILSQLIQLSFSIRYLIKFWNSLNFIRRP